MKRILALLLPLAVWASTLAQTLSLDSCQALARQHNRTLQAARLDAEQAADVRREAFTRYFPQLNATVLGVDSYYPLIELGIDDIPDADLRNLLDRLYRDFGVSRGLNNEFTLVENGLSASVSAVQPLYAGGRIVAGNRLARVGEEAAMLQVEVAQRDAELQVEQAYWLCVALAEKQHTLDRMQALLDTLQHTVDVAVGSGVATEVDRLRVQLKQDETAAQQMRLVNGLDLARRALCLAIGIPYSDSLVLSDTPQPLDLALVQPVDTLSSQRPELRLLELNIEAERLRRRMTLGEALPQLMVGAGWGWSNILLWDDHSHRGNNGIVWFALQVPISNWWATAHRLHAHDRAIAKARLQRDEMAEQMALQQRQAGSAMFEADARCRQCQRSVDKSEEAYRLALLGYQTGMQTITDLLEAQALLSDALGQLTDARVELATARHRYQALTAR